MECFFIEPVGNRRLKSAKGPMAIATNEVLYRRTDNGDCKWCDECAPGYEFGQGAMFFGDGYAFVKGRLYLIDERKHYIDLDINNTREGIPPMITVTHKIPMDWTLENGIFEAKKWKLELSPAGIRLD